MTTSNPSIDSILDEMNEEEESLEIQNLSTPTEKSHTHTEKSVPVNKTVPPPGRSFDTTTVPTTVANSNSSSGGGGGGNGSGNSGGTVMNQPVDKSGIESEPVVSTVQIASSWGKLTLISLKSSESAKLKYATGSEPVNQPFKIHLKLSQSAYMNHDVITLGRSQSNIMTPPEVSIISRSQASIRKYSSDGSNVILEDMNTRNGTMVNGMKIDRCRLKHGDYIIFCSASSLKTGEFVTLSNGKTRSQFRDEDSWKKALLTDLPLGIIYKFEFIEKSDTIRGINPFDQLPPSRSSTDQATTTSTTTTTTSSSITSTTTTGSTNSSFTSSGIRPSISPIDFTASSVSTPLIDLNKLSVASPFVGASSSAKLSGISSLLTPVVPESGANKRKLGQVTPTSNTPTQDDQEIKKIKRAHGNCRTNLTCNICYGYYISPHSLECGHTFCKKCLFGWLSKNCNCPQCRKDLTAHSYPNTAIDLVMQSVIPTLTESEISVIEQRKAKYAKEESENIALLEGMIQSAKTKKIDFLSIKKRWRLEEIKTFKNGVAQYMGACRRLYCDLIGLTENFAQHCTNEELIIACDNIALPVAFMIVGSDVKTLRRVIDFEKTRRRLISFQSAEDNIPVF